MSWGVHGEGCLGRSGNAVLWCELCRDDDSNVFLIQTLFFSIVKQLGNVLNGLRFKSSPNTWWYVSYWSVTLLKCHYLIRPSPSFPTDLKRFSEMRWTKLTNIVDFPTGVAELDLTPYAAESMDKSEPKPIYSLYAVSDCHTIFDCYLTRWKTHQLSIFFFHYSPLWLRSSRFQITWVSLAFCYKTKFELAGLRLGWCANAMETEISVEMLCFTDAS